MEPKNFLLLLFLFVVGYGVYGQKRPINNLPSTRASLDHVLDDVQPMDTIYHIEFATRVDSLYKYLDKDPKATWDIIFKDGIRKPDLQSGDILRVTSENNTIKYYFLKLEKYIPNTNAYLGSITWPDMPLDLKGEKAGVLGWKGDTIPSFDSLTMNYVLVLPLAYQRIPALTFATVNPNSKVMVTRAKSLEGSVADRTITFTVIAEDSITTRVYSVFLKKEQDTLDIQLKSTISSMFYKVSPGYS
ncbi:MAG TPA: hypothetical protein DCL77_14055, partial [Prolixibacteraceae bacterium]|nr:hypothetical protein [Prolixibacteraceae bacterium]